MQIQFQKRAPAVNSSPEKAGQWPLGWKLQDMFQSEKDQNRHREKAPELTPGAYGLLAGTGR